MTATHTDETGLEHDAAEDFDEGLHFGQGERQLGKNAPIKRFLRLIPRLPGFHLYGKRFAPRHLRLERVSVTIPDLAAELAGLRIGFLSDVHHDLGRPLALLARGVRLLNDAAPDLILMGGDYVVARAAGFAHCAELLGRLRAPLGVYGVLGNHDYWAGADRIAALVSAAGPTILRNEARRLTAPGGAPLWLIGLDDAARQRADLDLSFAGVPDDGAFRLLLAHEPDVADLLRERRVDLQLSGHSHGGQVVLPFFGPPLLPRLGRRYVNGLYDTGNHALYTSRGLGGVPPYIRFNCPPEVAVLTLTPGNARTTS